MKSIGLIKLIKNGKLPFLIFCCFAVSLPLLFVSINAEDVFQEGWEQKISELEPDLSFICLDNWTNIKETYQRGVLSIHLDRRYDNDLLKLVVTVLPIVYNQNELISEIETMLESSLYNPRPLQVEKIKYISDIPVIIVDTTAGERDLLFIRTAGFVREGRSYIITILARDESFSRAVAEIENLLASIDFD